MSSNTPKSPEIKKNPQEKVKPVDVPNPPDVDTPSVSQHVLLISDIVSNVDLIGSIIKSHPEIQWLTGEVNATPEAGIKDPEKVTLGEQLFPNLDKAQLLELNRTAVGILVLKWILNGDYDSFTACQKEGVKLSPESFRELQSYLKAYLSDSESIEAMVTYMVINDLTKVKSVVADLAQKTGTHNVDHDKLLLVALEQHPDISPSYQRLSPKYQKLILDGLKAEFNIGQFIQAENVPASLEGLKGIDGDGLKFYLIHALCDIGGAAGQFVQNGSAVMTEPTYQGFKHSIASIEQLMDGRSTVEVYDSFLGKKTEGLNLDITDPKQRAVARVCCMLRFSERQQAEQVLEAWDSLSKNVRAILETELNKNGVDDGFATLVYYSPAIFANLQKSMNAQNGSKEFKESIMAGLITLARIYNEARIALKHREGNGVFTVMASNVAKIAGETPQDLEKHNISLKPVGEDVEIRLEKFPVIDLSKFEEILDLNDIPGDTIILGGMGGGSDAVQAAQLAKLLKGTGKNVPCIFSVRTDKTSSQGPDGKIGEDRTPQNAEQIADGVYLIKPETEMKGRSLEPIVCSDIPTYLIIIKEGTDLTAQLESLKNHIGNVDTIIGVDTGGDALYSTIGHDQSKATPDQDIQVLKAINKMSGVNKFSCEIAVGIDTPENGEEVLKNAQARYFNPSDQQANSVISQYEDWQMDGTNDQRFGKTPLSWQKALRNEMGLQSIDLPTRVVLDPKNPWKPFVNIQQATRGLFFMGTANHLHAIGA